MKVDKKYVEERNSRIKICDCCRALLEKRVFLLGRRMPYYRVKGHPCIVNLPEVVLFRHGFVKSKGDAARFRDGDKTNCDIKNLFYYPISLSCIGVNNRDGCKAVGVYKLGDYYRAVITMNGIHVYSELFKTFEQAKIAHDEKVKQLKMEIT